MPQYAKHTGCYRIFLLPFAMHIMDIFVCIMQTHCIILATKLQAFFAKTTFPDVLSPSLLNKEKPPNPCVLQYANDSVVFMASCTDLDIISFFFFDNLKFVVNPFIGNHSVFVVMVSNKKSNKAITE